MDIKEQVTELLCDVELTRCYLTKDCKAYDNCYQCAAVQIHSLYEQAGYLPIQAGEDGLLADEEIQELYDSDDYGDGFALWKEIAIRQKALTESQAKQKQADIVVACDMLITELISYKDGKLTFKDIEPSLQRWNQYRIEAFKKQTLEEI